MGNKFLNNQLNKHDIMDRKGLLGIIVTGLISGKESLLFDLISNNVVKLNNESTLKDYEDLIKSIDFKSKVFINSTEPDKLTVIGDLWKFLGIKGMINYKGEIEPMRGWVERATIELLYSLITITILQRLVSKIIYLSSEKPGSEELIDSNVLLQEYLRKIDPRIRKYLKGSRINIIDKVYAGYDTEFKTKEYSVNNLLSTQLAYTGTVIIRVNNIDKGFDFSENILSDGTITKDFSFDVLLEKVPALKVVTEVIKDVIKELRDYMENSINNDFIKELEQLHERGLLIKTNERDNVVEYTVPLLEEDGVPKYNTELNYHKAGDTHPTFKAIIDNLTSLSLLTINERYNYFKDLLNDNLVIDNDDSNIVNNNDDNNDDGILVPVPVLGSGSDSDSEIVPSFNQSLAYKYIPNHRNDNNLNPFVKDNKHPNELSNPNGILRGEHRRNTIVILGCHFSIADLSILSDFDSIKNKFDIVQGTLTTIAKPYKLDKGRTVYLRDTMLLAPAGKAALGDLGVLYNLPKLDVGDYITRMGDLRDENPRFFESYAIRDAEISLRHIIEMEIASFKLTGIGNVPTTLSSLARKFVFKYWKDKNLDLTGFINFGKYTISDFVSLFTPKALQSTGQVGFTLPGFLGTYRGGRNESYVYGIDRETIWYDYDLKGAYTTAMSLLGIPDFDLCIQVTEQKQLDKFMDRCSKPTSTVKSMENVLHKENVTELFKVDPSETTLENTYSIFRVKFTFPDTVLHPSLPVSLNDTSTLYPLEGETVVTGYEIYLALSQGCKIELKQGIIVPYRTLHRPYLEVISYLQKERNIYKENKNHLYELLYKQLGNSLYGQTAQGFNNARKLNARTGNLESTGTSPLSNALISSHTSALTRAVLGEVIRQIDAKGGKIVSCTTDGLITNIPDLLTSLDYESKLLDIFGTLRQTLVNDKSILEIKSVSKGIASWSTRGQLGIETLINPKDGKKYKPISAMTGFQPKFLSMDERVDLIETAMASGIYEIYYGQDSIRKANDIFRYGGHVTSKITEKIFRVVYDNRRRIVDTGLEPSNNLLFTQPFKDLDTALTINTISNLGNDLYAPNSGYTNKSGSKDYIDIAVRSFIRALVQGKLNLENPFSSYIDIVKYVKSTFNYNINVNYIASQKRRNFIPKMVPINEQTRLVVDNIKIKFPDFNEKDFFRPLKKAD